MVLHPLPTTLRDQSALIDAGELGIAFAQQTGKTFGVGKAGNPYLLACTSGSDTMANAPTRREHCPLTPLWTATRFARGMATTCLFSTTTQCTRPHLANDKSPGDHGEGR